MNLSHAHPCLTQLTQVQGGVTLGPEQGELGANFSYLGTPNSLPAGKFAPKPASQVSSLPNLANLPHETAHQAFHRLLETVHALSVVSLVFCQRPAPDDRIEVDARMECHLAQQQHSRWV
jgi:hypothetical protein